MRRPAPVSLLALASSLPLLVVPLLAVPAVAGPGAVQPAVRAQARMAERALLKASEVDIIPGERLRITAGAPRVEGYTTLPRAERRRARLVLQHRVGKVWRKVAVRRLKRTPVHFAFSAASTATGTVGLRTVAKLDGRTFRAGRLRLPVHAQALAATAAGSTAGGPVTFAGTLTPVRAGRPVEVQVHDAGTWTTVSSADASGLAVSLGVTSPAYPVWYRVVAGPWHGVPAVATAPVRTRLDRLPSVIAHRAGAGTAPEQTLAAVRQTIADGVPAMEIDVQLTSDQQLVVVHDKTFRRTTDVATVFPGRESDPIGSFSLAEVKSLDAGSWFGSQFAGERIPTLDEVLDEIGGRAHLVIEVKDPVEAAGNDQVDELLLAELAAGRPLRALADAGRLSFSSFDIAWLQAFTAQLDASTPGIPVGVLTTLPPTGAQLQEWKAWGADEVHPNAFLVGRTTLDAARALGMPSSVWTIRSVDDYRRALATGADSIITDFPLLMAEVVDPPQPAP